jgi:hypothetical protein
MLDNRQHLACTAVAGGVRRMRQRFAELDREINELPYKRFRDPRMRQDRARLLAVELDYVEGQLAVLRSAMRSLGMQAAEIR